MTAISEQSLTAIEKLILIITSYCNTHNIPYTIVGGIAVLFWGRTRTTQDVDIIVDHRKLVIDDFVGYLQKNGISCSKNDIQEAFQNKQHSNSNFFENTVFRLDIKGIYSEAERQTVEECYHQKWHNTMINIDNPINLIVNKLRFGSQQDHEDALAVLIRNRENIDLKFLMSRAEEFNVRKNLDKLLKTAKIS